MPHKFARNRLLKLPSSHLRGQEILQEKVECTYKTPRGGRISMWNYQCAWKFYLFCRMYSYVEKYCESTCGGVHTVLQRQASRHHNVCHHAQHTTFTMALCPTSSLVKPWPPLPTALSPTPHCLPFQPLGL